METQGKSRETLPRGAKVTEANHASDLSTELFPLTMKPIDECQVETAAGRDIHAFLGISREYATWVRAQIKRLQLIENRDYVVFPLEVRKPQAQGGRPAIEYHFTKDATKHVGLASGSAKGYEIREWFIARENQLAVIEKATASWDLLAQMVENGRRQALRIETLEQADQRRTAQQMAQQQAMIALQAQQIESLQLAQNADAKSDMANTKADLALDEAHRMTLEGFLTKNGLLPKFPNSQRARIVHWLIDYCQRYGLTIRKIPVVGKPWPDENGYLLAALAAWLHYEQTKPWQVRLLDDTGRERA